MNYHSNHHAEIRKNSYTVAGLIIRTIKYMPTNLQAPQGPTNESLRSAEIAMHVKSCFPSDTACKKNLLNMETNILDLLCSFFCYTLRTSSLAFSGFIRKV